MDAYDYYEYEHYTACTIDDEQREQYEEMMLANDLWEHMF